MYVRRLSMLLVPLVPLVIGGCASSAYSSAEAERAAQGQRIEELERELETARSEAVRVGAAAAAQTAALERRAEELEALVEQAAVVPGTLWEPIHFEVASTEIGGPDVETLEEFAQTMRQRPDVRIGLIGRADPRGSEAANLELSARRAEAARDHLLRSGIEPWRIDVVAAGESSPIVEAQDDAAHAANRSVQAVVLPPGEAIQVGSVPSGARVYFFRVGSEWDSVRTRLDDLGAINRYRVIEGDTPVRTYRGRTFFNVMLVLNGARRFSCGLQVTRGNPNVVNVSFAGAGDEQPCP